MEQATKKQLWAIYCLLKKDYRNSNLSKDEASIIISNAKKEKKGSSNESFESEIKREIYNYFKEGEMKKIVNICNHACEKQSVVTVEGCGSKHNYAFFGSGCGITYFKYNGNNKRAKVLEKVYYELKWKELKELFISYFPKEVISYYDSVGFPLEAMFSQDYDIQKSLGYAVANFAKVKYDIKLQVISNYD